MAALSIFIDESGNCGHYQPYNPRSNCFKFVRYLVGNYGFVKVAESQSDSLVQGDVPYI